jgi:hypothetical protein
VALAQPAAELELPSCVAGSPPLRVSSAAEQTRLDAADRQRLHEAAQARYALYQRGGMVPSQVMMLRRGRHWQYVTLWQGGASRPCFTAVFAADRFDFTAQWIAKYKPRAAQADD